MSKRTFSKLSINKLSAILSMITLSLLIIWLCMGVGFGEWNNPNDIEPIIWELRYPRVLTALMVGLALSVSGAALQALFENPLADPSLIGTSGGASLGVVLVISFGISGIGVPLAAFFGSMLVCLLILSIHKWLGGGKIGLLILGFIISSFCGALVSLILFMSDDLVLRSAVNWLSGSLAEAGFVPLKYAFFAIILGLIILIPLGRQLDALLLGETTATTMGVNVQVTRTLVIAATALLTGAAVSISGMIGFIGMMIPNLLIILFGGGRTRLMTWSGWLGGIFLLVIDSISRFLSYPIDLPIGIVLALLGAPFFIWIFMQSTRR